jgi:outer membrane protein assembly factor BamB
MNCAARLCAVIAATLLLTFPTLVSGQDWPQWRGVNRDAKAAGFNVPETWPKELTQKWKVVVGDGVATPALVGERLYVFSRQGPSEIIRCLEAKSGHELWSDNYEVKPADGFAKDFPGPRASPIVAHGKLITLGVRGTLSCYDATSGKREWRKDDFNAWPQFFTSSSPIILDGLCIAQLGNDKDGGLVAYDLATGSEKWKWLGDGTAYGSPQLITIDGTPLIVALTAKSLVALGVTDHKVAWQIPYAPPPRGLNYNSSTPLIDGNMIVVSGGGRGTKAVKLEQRDGKLAATEIWSNPKVSVQFNTPVIKNGFIYGLTTANVLFCLNATDGETAWTTPRIEGRAGYGAIVDAGSVLVALGTAANLIVFEPNGKEFKEIAKYKVGDINTYSYPVLSGNRIYIKDKDSLILWTGEPQT